MPTNKIPLTYGALQGLHCIVLYWKVRHIYLLLKRRTWERIRSFYKCFYSNSTDTVWFAVSLPTMGQQRYNVLRLYVHPLTPVLRDMIFLYLVVWFQWNLTQIFIMWAGIADKVFKVRDQRSNWTVCSPTLLLHTRHTVTPAVIASCFYCIVLMYHFDCITAFDCITTRFVILHYPSSIA